LLAPSVLFGSSVTSSAFFRGLNDEGQIAFAYGLANGQKGIALATPRDPAVLGNGSFDNGIGLFQVLDAASDGFAYVPNVGGNPRLEMTTTTGVLGVLQRVQSLPASYQLKFDFDWLTGAGSLRVHVTEVLALTIGADGSVSSPLGVPAVQSLGDSTRVALELTPAANPEPDGGSVRFDLHPGSEATIQLDDISFAPVPEPGDAGVVVACGVAAILGGRSRRSSPPGALSACG
jgi:hypothetical protein